MVQQHLATFLAHLEGNDQAGRLPAYGALLGYGTAELDALRRDGAI